MRRNRIVRLLIIVLLGLSIIPITVQPARALQTTLVAAQGPVPAPSPSSSFGGPEPGNFGWTSSATVDGQGNLYVADYLNSRIQKFDSQGKFLNQFSTVAMNCWQHPQSIALSNNGTLFVAGSDHCSPNLEKFALNGTLIGSWTYGAGGYFTPSLTVDSHGFVYVGVETGYGTGGVGDILKYDSNGVFIQAIGYGSRYWFETAITNDGTYLYEAMYCSAANGCSPACTPTNAPTYTDSCRLVKMYLNGTGVFEFGNLINQNPPGGLAVDPTGNIYLADTGISSILKFAGDGTLLAQIGTKGQGPGQLYFPTSLFIDSTGRFYVADSGNDRIQVFDQNWNFLYAIGKSTLYARSPGNFPNLAEYSSSTGLYVVDCGLVYGAAFPGADCTRLSKFDTNGNLLSRLEFCSPFESGFSSSGFGAWCNGGIGPVYSMVVNRGNGTVYIGFQGGAYSRTYFLAFQPNPLKVVSAATILGGRAGQSIAELAIDSQGFVYGMSSPYGYVAKFAGNLSLITSWPSNNAITPNVDVHGLGVDSQGLVYISTSITDGCGCIDIYQLNGTFTTRINNGVGGQHVATDFADNFYVSDYASGLLTKYDRLRSQVFNWTLPNLPFGITVDNTGTIYGAEAVANTPTREHVVVSIRTYLTAPPPAFDYLLSNSGAVSITQRSSGSVTLTAKLTAGTAQSVMLSCVTSTLPTGASCSFNPSSVTPTLDGATSGLTVHTTSSTPAASFHVQVTGNPRGATTIPTTFTLTVTAPPLHSTHTIISCSPNTVVVGQTATCMTTVTDTSTSPTIPTGTVAFSGGTFSPNQCTLTAATTAATATCTSTFTGSTTGVATITATYSGDTTHGTSTSDATTVTVNLRTTGLAFHCDPVSVLVGTATTCRVAVTDESAGSATGTMASTPTGTVALTTSGSGVFNQTSCTLTGSGPTSFCVVTYTPSGTTARIDSITASYSGDSSHAASANAAQVSVTVTTPSVSTISCGHDLYCSIQSNSTLSNIRFAGNTIHVEATGTRGAVGYANVTVPVSAVPHSDTLHVFVDNSKLGSSSVTITSNSTSYFIYFTFTFHSPVLIDIQLTAQENVATPTILGVDPTIFYEIVGTLAVIVIVTVALGYRRYRKPKG